MRWKAHWIDPTCLQSVVCFCWRTSTILWKRPPALCRCDCHQCCHGRLRVSRRKGASASRILCFQFWTCEVSLPPRTLKLSRRKHSRQNRFVTRAVRRFSLKGWSAISFELKPPQALLQQIMLIILILLVWIPGPSPIEACASVAKEGWPLGSGPEPLSGPSRTQPGTCASMRFLALAPFL